MAWPHALGTAAWSTMLGTVPFSFESRADARRAIDGWVARHQPSQTAVDLVEFEREHLLWFSTEYGRLLAQFEAAFDQLVGVTADVNYVDRTSRPEH